MTATFAPVGATAAKLSQQSKDLEALRRPPANVPRAMPTVTTNTTLPVGAVGTIVPINNASASNITLPLASQAWAIAPYGKVGIFQRGAGVPTFVAQGGDQLRTPTGYAASVQYGFRYAIVVSATEWALSM